MSSMQKSVDRKEDTAVIVKYGKDIEGVTVHKGSCHDRLYDRYIKMGVVLQKIRFRMF